MFSDSICCVSICFVSMHFVNYRVCKIKQKNYLFSWTVPEPSGRQIGEMVLVKLTSDDRVMMA
jgi:hypothetical protein